MSSLQHLIDANRNWAKAHKQQDSDFFKQSAIEHKPEYLWIGCADSRVPANAIVGLQPGQLFEHRNVANLVIHTDFNCLSVMQFAVEVLKVKHIIVCGHEQCGGVLVALDKKPRGLIDNWIRNIKDVYHKHQKVVDRETDTMAKVNKLSALNVGEQVLNVCHTSIVQEAWSRQQSLTVHGWMYSLAEGHVNDLGISVSSPDQISPLFHLSGV